MRLLPLVVLLACGAKDEDGYGSGADGGANNKVPSAAGIALGPPRPDTQTDLVVLIEEPATDGDGDELSYRYVWEQDGVVRTDLTDATIDSIHTTRMEVWTVTVTAFDEWSTGPEVSDSVEIANSPPQLSAITIAPAEIDELSEVTCTTGETSDGDYDLVGVMTRWVVSGEELDTEGPLYGDDFDKGDEILCRAYLDDGVETVTQDSRTVVVQNAAPWVVGVTLSHNNPTPEDTLEAIPEGWWDDDDDPEGYLYAWFINWTLASEEPTIDSSVFSPGDNIFVELTAFDGVTVGNTVASHSATAVNTPEPGVDGR